MSTDLSVTDPSIVYLVLGRKPDETIINLGVRLTPSIRLGLSITLSLDIAVPIGNISLPHIRLRTVPEVEGCNTADAVEGHFVLAICLDGRETLSAATVAAAPAPGGPVV